MQYTDTIDVATGDLATRINIIWLGYGSARNRNIKTKTLPLFRANEAVPNGRTNPRIPLADEITTRIDTNQDRIHGTGKVNFRKNTFIPNETVIFEQIAVGIEEIPITYDSTGFIDPKSECVGRAREIQGSNNTAAQEESVSESV